MNFKSKYGQYDFKEDDELFWKIICHPFFKEVHIDISSDNPYMLLLRVKEKNVVAMRDNERVVFSKNDKHKTGIFNLLINKIENRMIKKYSDNMYELIFTIGNLQYQMTVIK